MSRGSGGKPPFLTCKVCYLERFNIRSLTGQEEGLAPAVLLYLILHLFFNTVITLLMELFRALAVLAEPPVAEAARVAEALELGAVPEAAEYTEVFIFQLYPYASVYLGEEGMLGGEARDRVGGFWRVSGGRPPAEPMILHV